MQSLVFLTYFFSKVIEEKPFGGRLPPPAFGKGRVKIATLLNEYNWNVLFISFPAICELFEFIVTP